MSASHASAIFRRASRSGDAARSANLRHWVACCWNDDAIPAISSSPSNFTPTRFALRQTTQHDRDT